ncbi:MAG: hypothetical protein HOP00_08855, partial [Nitrospira sp.]|nr:hypothetical protein [Nitrospira sp.]
MRGASFLQLCGLIATCLIPRLTLADEPAKELSVLTTDEVVISATRTAEPIGQSAASITVLTREQIERSPYTGGHQLDDLLRSVPGVQPATLSSRYNHP